MVITDAAIEKMKRALREKEMPLFENEDLGFYLEEAETLNEAIYNAAIAKSENTTLQISGMTTADMSSYFLRIASMYRPNNTGILKNK
jgi:hypothetical protein